MDRYVLWFIKFFIRYYFKLIKIRSRNLIKHVVLTNLFLPSFILIFIQALRRKITESISGTTDRHTDRHVDIQTRQTDSNESFLLSRGLHYRNEICLYRLRTTKFSINNFRLWQYSHLLSFINSILGKNMASHLKLKSFSSCFVEKWKSDIYSWSLLKVVLQIRWWYSCSWKFTTHYADFFLFGYLSWQIL